MAITYSWQLTGMRRRDTGNLSGVVYQTYWRKMGVDETGVYGEFSGATSFDTSQVNPNEFVPYSALTESTVLGWIQSAINDDYSQHIDSLIAGEIARKKENDKDASIGSFPWDPVPPPPPIVPITPSN
jgi:hypothetical protein